MYRGKILEKKIATTEIKYKIYSNYDSKMKSKAIQR